VVYSLFLEIAAPSGSSKPSIRASDYLPETLNDSRRIIIAHQG